MLLVLQYDCHVGGKRAPGPKFSPPKSHKQMDMMVCSFNLSRREAETGTPGFPWIASLATGGLGAK